MYCEKCNTFLPPGQNVCVKCGHVNTKENQSAVVSHQNQDFRNPQNAFLESETTTETLKVSESSSQKEENPKTIKRNLILIWILFIFTYILPILSNLASEFYRPITNIFEGIYRFIKTFSLSLLSLMLPGVLAYHGRSNPAWKTFLYFMLFALIRFLIFEIHSFVIFRLVFVSFIFSFVVYYITKKISFWIHDALGANKNIVYAYLLYTEIFLLVYLIVELIFEFLFDLFKFTILTSVFIGL